MSVRHLALVFVAVFGFTALASATPITYHYTGTATATTGTFATQLTNNVTGTFTFDDSVADVAGGGLFDQFNSNAATNNVWEITLALGAMSVTTATNARVAGTSHHRLFLFDAAQDLFNFSTDPDGVIGDDFAAITLIDSSPTPPDGITPGTGALPGTMAGAMNILNNLDMATFSQLGSSFWFATNSTGDIEGELRFSVTSLSQAPTAVPEPATLLLFGTGLAAAGIRRYRRKQ